jgi:hypothetical protein
MFAMPLLDEYAFQLESFHSKIEKELDSSDENTVVEFISHEVAPLLWQLAARKAELAPQLKEIFGSEKKYYDVYYRKRKQFEESLTRINETVGAYLEAEEDRTQLLMPHFFEKYKTDGVEYNIYLGQSLLQDEKFSMVYVKNFRLWQLISMVEIARRTNKLKAGLEFPLETTQLVLCYSNPFSIQFRMDEKHFDVAGAYNIRYEIVKKRIDKAHIRGTSERITQPHTIAVIYSNDREALEYERYFNYLRARQYITGATEVLEVEPLQGIQGLKALRVKVNYENANAVSWNEEELMKQVQQVVNTGL